MKPKQKVVKPYDAPISQTKIISENLEEWYVSFGTSTNLHMQFKQYNDFWTWDT